ncbi:membrane protein insertase YidC [Magnetovibrio sp. PR-2]|uniref:membrane protein insertase YidC n=1 Tax=Magnetovibrio sp. PR-2 TaxID=3120356 RepID=UPI002FCE5F0B
MDNRNLILAVVLSVAILFGFELIFPSKPVQTTAEQTQQTVGQDPALPTAPQMPSATPQAAQTTGQAGTMAGADMQLMDKLNTAEELVKQGARVSITSPSVTGSIALKGGRIDDLILNTYNETLDEGSAKIRLLTPRGTMDSYYAEYGWVGTNIKTPNNESEWTADRTVLDPANPVTLSWNNGEGLTFKRTIAIDKDYMFTITQRVENNSGEAVTMSPYGLVTRWGTPEVSGLYILHEGPLGVFEGVLEEFDYDDLVDDGTLTTTGGIRNQTTGGWIGFTDKYWLTALVPDQKQTVNTRMFYTQTGMIQKYQTDFVGQQFAVAPGQTAEATTHFFAGAKRVTLLDQYAQEHGIVNFDLAVDFGMFYFLTKPIFHALHWLHGVLGNFGVAILLLTVAIKLVLFPLANKSYTAMSKMKKLQPEIKKMQERFKDDKMRLNQEMMALYKKEKANPAAGCLPILVQIPIFFALYKVLLVTIEMRHAPFFGWIQDLSAKDPATILTGFGFFPWDVPVMLSPFDIGVWPIIMGLTMYMQQKLNPAPTDPVQAKIFMYLPFIFTFMLAQFSAGLVIYWAWNNALSILQQWVIMRRMGVKVGG